MSSDRADLLLAEQTSKWKVTNSLWVAVVVLGFGCLSIAGWVWAAALSQTRRMWLMVVFYAFWTAVIATLAGLSPTDDTGAMTGVTGNVAIAVMLVVWIGGSIHAFDETDLMVVGDSVIMRSVLKDRLLRLDKSPSHALSPRPTKSTTSQAGPTQSAPSSDVLGVDGSDYYAPGPDNAIPTPTAKPTGYADPFAPLPPPPAADPGPASSSSPDPVDLNSADAEELASLPRLDAAQVQAIVAARQRTGGFGDLDQLVASTGLQPHHVAAIRDHIRFGPFEPRHRPHGGRGRILDV